MNSVGPSSGASLSPESTERGTASEILIVHCVHTVYTLCTHCVHTVYTLCASFYLLACAQFPSS